TRPTLRTLLPSHLTLFTHRRHQTAGPSRAQTKNSAWYTCPWVTSPRTNGAATAEKQQTTSLLPLSLWTLKPDAYVGYFRPCITISGITTCPPNPASST